MEKYTRLYHDDGISYFPGSPVVIEAKALLKDNTNGWIIGQAKLLNISKQIVKAVFVTVVLYNAAHKEIGTTKHEYLDLSVPRDKEFGQQSAIVIDNPSARYFDLIINEVVFSDGTIWDNHSDAISLDSPLQLSQYYKNEKAVSGYQIKCGDKARFLPYEIGQIWRCTCGAYNDASEDHCHNCRNEKQQLFEIPLENDLIETYCEHTYAEAQEAMCSARNEEEYRAASKRFFGLNGYRDSESLEKKCRYLADEECKKEKYKDALEIIQMGTLSSLNEGLVLLEELAGWGDANYQREMVKERIARIIRKKKTKKIIWLMFVFVAALIIGFVVFVEMREYDANKAIDLYASYLQSQSEELVVDSVMKDYSVTQVNFYVTDAKKVKGKYAVITNVICRSNKKIFSEEDRKRIIETVIEYFHNENYEADGKVITTRDIDSKSDTYQQELFTLTMNDEEWFNKGALVGKEIDVELSDAKTVDVIALIVEQEGLDLDSIRLPVIYYDVFELYASNLNKSSYSFDTVLQELKETDYVVAYTRPTEEALGTIYVRPGSDNCMVYIEFYPNKSNIETITSVSYGDAEIGVVTADDSAHAVTQNYSFLYDGKYSVTNLIELEDPAKIIYYRADIEE